VLSAICWLYAEMDAATVRGSFPYGNIFHSEEQKYNKGTLVASLYCISLFNMRFHPSPEDQERFPKEMRVRSPSRSASRHTVLRGRRGYETGDKITYYFLVVK
jgi:hypothetical protein